MANRYFQEATLSLVKRKAEVYCVVSVGGAGAVTMKRRSYSAGGATAVSSSTSLVAAPTTGVGYAVGGDGVRSVARTGTGAWTVTLSDPYQYMLGCELLQTSNTTGLPTAAAVGIVSGSTDVTTNTGTGNGGVVAIQLVDFAGNAVDPASGDTLTLRFTFGDATEP